VDTIAAPPAETTRPFASRSPVSRATVALALGVVTLGLGISLGIWTTIVSHRNAAVTARLAAVEEAAHTQTAALAGLNSTVTRTNASGEQELAKAKAATRRALGQATAQISAIQAQLDALTTQLDDTHTVDVGPLTARLEKTQRSLTHVVYCLPELASSINGVRFEGYGTDGWLQGGYITNGYNISRFCSDVLTAAPTGEGDG
jgi:uncharacterized coiled-coil protein SlyX